MSTARPLPRNDSGWDAAFRRVEAYLGAHRVTNRIALTAMANEIVSRAHTHAADRPGADPVALALEEADAAMAQWFGRVLGPEARFSRRLSVRGRLALALTDGPARWPEHFLAPQPAPPALVEEMRSVYVQPTPQLQPVAMTPKPLPLSPFGRHRDDQPAGRLHLPGLTGWLLLGAAAIGLWWNIR